MPIVRYQFNFGNVYLTSGGLAQSTRCLCRDSVQCTRGAGQTLSAPFKGFTSIFRHRQFERVTVHNIKAIKAGNDILADGTWQELSGEYLGVLVDGGVYLVLGDRELPVIDDKYEKSQMNGLGHVVDMMEFRRTFKTTV
ncbi:hypothetical protein [Pseudoalteromonas obscura]|uniref:Uncharacterized protein n=1 Tax=Pseudoalteromonas obscura TaxID=3048491 RepID=A0ABT7EGQ2_9GAMM|nr:hypothetical protein [Pseudoalteromonas sp. P94(2023)]MDK2594225.1 hypothetical protein [Pseudoalteromonas sp. P94(2023)]